MIDAASAGASAHASASAHAANVQRAEEWVKAAMKGNDSSHDWW